MRARSLVPTQRAHQFVIEIRMRRCMFSPRVHAVTVSITIATAVTVAIALTIAPHWLSIYICIYIVWGLRAGVMFFFLGGEREGARGLSRSLRTMLRMCASRSIVLDSADAAGGVAKSRAALAPAIMSVRQPPCWRSEEQVPRGTLLEISHLTHPGVAAAPPAARALAQTQEKLFKQLRPGGSSVPPCL